MGQKILHINRGSFRTTISTEHAGLAIELHAGGDGIHGGQTVSMELSESEARSMAAALKNYLDSRETKFNVGDIVYEPTHYKRAAEVILILEDRIFYDAPYRIQFIDQAEGQPPTDYFAAEDLVLVQRKAEKND